MQHPASCPVAALCFARAPGWKRVQQYRVVLPADEYAIAAVFARMPREVAGEVNDGRPAVRRWEGYLCVAYGWVDPRVRYE